MMDSLGKSLFVGCVPFFLSKSCVCKQCGCIVFVAGAGLPPTLETGCRLPVWARQAAANPNVQGGAHCIFSCNSIVKDLCGLAVGSSRNTRKVWVTLPIPVVYVNEDPAEVKHRDIVLAEGLQCL